MKPTGGAAFPVPQAESVHCKGEIVQYAEPGMTLRDWFAGMALQGLIMRDSIINTDTASIKSYDFADAMLKAREE